MICRLVAAALAVAAGGAHAAERVAPPASAFEVLGASQAWVALRENVVVGASDTDVCRYPGLDPSVYKGSIVHFVALSPSAISGKMFAPDLGAAPAPYLTPGTPQGGCTSLSEAQDRWRAIVARAKEIDIPIGENSRAPIPLGQPVTEEECELAARRGRARVCDAAFIQTLAGQRFRIALSIRSAPEAPDKARCQFIGYRIGVAVQITGGAFGSVGAPAPGGFVTHYDWRSQHVEPMKLYAFDRLAVLLVCFSSTNIADRTSTPSLVVFPIGD